MNSLTAIKFSDDSTKRKHEENFIRFMNKHDVQLGEIQKGNWIHASNDLF